jgi:hypothetical protein
VRNLTGGIAPSSANVDFISKAGTPSREFLEYIPVGQGFSLVVVQAQQILKSFSKIVKEPLLKNTKKLQCPIQTAGTKKKFGQ